MYKYGYGYHVGKIQDGALLNQTPIIPDGTPTAAYDVTDVGFKVVSSVDTKSETVVTLEYGTVTGVYTNTVTAAESPVNATGDVNFTLTGLTPFTDYYFRVKAVNSAGTAYSQEFVQKTAEPAIISDGNTVAWYDFASGITKDGSNFVSAWNSRIGTNHLAQAVGTNQPLHTVDGVVFDGIDNFMKSVSSFALSQPLTYYVVIKQISWTNTEPIFLNMGTLFQRTQSPELGYFAGNASIVATQAAIGNLVIIRIIANGASSKIQVNENTATTGNAGTAGLSQLFVGTNDTLYGNFMLSEYIARKVSDSAGNEAEIYNYLKKKYSL